MSQIYLLINGEQSRPYSSDDIASLVSNGHIRSDTLAWWEGLSQWTPIGELVPSLVPIVPFKGLNNTVPTRARPWRQSAFEGSMACLAIGLLLMCASLWMVYLYAPLFLASFVLSISAMAQGRIFGGLMALFLALVGPPTLWVYLASPPATNVLTSSQSPSKPSELSPEDGESSQYPALDAKMGFAGYKIGTPLDNFDQRTLTRSDYSNLSSDHSGNSESFFLPKGAGQFGTIQVENILGKFDHGVLTELTVFIGDLQNSLEMKEALSEAYGQPTREEISPFIGSPVTYLEWKGQKCQIKMEMPNERGVALSFSSSEINQEIKDSDAKKDQAAKEAADALVRKQVEQARADAIRNAKNL